MRGRNQLDAASVAFDGFDPARDAVWMAEVAGERDDTWVHASDDPYLPIHYPTVYLTPFLQRDERWLSTSVCQTAEFDDFMVYGEVIAEAVRRSDRRVVVLASGALSHRFWPLRELRQREGADPSHVYSAAHRAADERVISLLERGDHATVWTGSQKPHYAAEGVARITGLPVENVHGIWVQGPGSYGRNDAGDAAIDAAILVKAVKNSSASLRAVPSIRRAPI